MISTCLILTQTLLEKRNQMFKMFFALAVFVGASACMAGPKQLRMTMDNAVLITSAIDPATMQNRIKELAVIQAKGQGANIIINSPGGEVYSTLAFINVMEQIKSSGNKVRCLVMNGAASAAFQILAHCSERYVFSHSFLLWHPVRVGVGFGASFTPTEAQGLANSLSYIEDILVTDLRKYLKVSDANFYQHYHLESLHTGESLQPITNSFVQIVGTLVNLQEVQEKAKKQQEEDNKNAFGRLFGKYDYTSDVIIPDFY